MTAENIIAIIEHHRWLISKNLGHIDSFQARSIEILGFNGLVLSIVLANFNKFMINQNTKTSFNILLGFYAILFLFEILLFVIVNIPRRSSVPLTSNKKLDEILTNLIDYHNQIMEYLKYRAKVTMVIYIFFLIQMLLLFVILSILIK